MEIVGLDYLDRQMQVLVQSLAKGAAQNVREHPQLAPVAFLDSAAGRILPVLLELGSGAEKSAMAAKLRDLARDHKSNFVLLLIESWTLLDQDATKEFLAGYPVKYKSVSEHPKAVEAVMMALETRDSGSYVATVPIGANRVLEPKVEFVDASQSTGRFTNLLPKIFH